jgi:type IX secretion system PorP/SprF family membrane protein
MLLPELRSGIGIQFLGDKAGAAALKSNIVNFLYSYKIVTPSRWIIAPGLTFGLGYRSLDFNKLLFKDQLNLDSRNTLPTNEPSIYNASTAGYFDFGASMLIYNPKVWMGASFSHINKPNRSLIGNNAPLPMKINVHGGLRIPIKSTLLKTGRNAAILPSFNYRNQGGFDQLDIGSYLIFDPVILGVWYRGIPIRQKKQDNINQDAIVAMLGFQFSSFEVMYSYDMTISKFGPSTGGAHEMSLKYEINRIQKKIVKKQRFIPCPAFYNNRDLNLEKLNFRQ